MREKNAGGIICYSCMQHCSHMLVQMGLSLIQSYICEREVQMHDCMSCDNES